MHGLRSRPREAPAVCLPCVMLSPSEAKPVCGLERYDAGDQYAAEMTIQRTLYACKLCTTIEFAASSCEIRSVSADVHTCMLPVRASDIAYTPPSSQTSTARSIVSLRSDAFQCLHERIRPPHRPGAPWARVCILISQHCWWNEGATATFRCN